ncbi:hypothetical protein PG995_012198 [Apiospora arundinis]
MSSEEIYSQGFNFGCLVQHGVDNRTGQYGCTVPLYEAPSEALNCPAFKLSLNYNAFGSRDIGFGQGWDLNLSRYQHRKGRTLCLVTGEQYQVYDSANSVMVKDQKLKSFQFEKLGSNYSVTYKSGQREILSNANNIYDVSVPVEIFAPNARSLRLSWTPVASVPRLTKVSDEVHDLLTIEYMPNSGMTKVTCSPGTPESSTFVFTQQNRKLSKLTLPGDCGNWNFKYRKYKNHDMLTEVTNPAGLLETMTYKPDGHTLPPGAPMRAIPHILSHTIYPAKQQPPTTTTYNFSSNNFLGHGGVHSWRAGEDNLYRSPAEYNYTSTVMVEGGATTTYTYNKYHLVLSKKRQHLSKSMTEEITYHAALGQGFEDQPPQYQLPKVKKTTYADLATEGASRSEMATCSFDIWGNPTETIDSDGIRTTQTYFPAEGEQGLCPPDPHGFVRYLKAEVKSPESGGPSLTKQYTYTRLPSVSSPSSSAFEMAKLDTRYFVAVKEQLFLHDDQYLTSRKYLYVNEPESTDHGRIREHVERLDGKQPNSQSLQYEHDEAHRLKTKVKTTSHDGLVTHSETVCAKSTGATVSQTDEPGFRQTYDYDSVGRVVVETIAVGTPFEATRRYDRALCPDGKGYEVTQTDANGYKTRVITDAMERTIQFAKQEDRDAGDFRVVEQFTYNALGQCIQVEEIDWIASTQTEIRLKKTIEFDLWGQACKISDGTGSAHIASTDPITQTETIGIEGESMTRTQVGASGEVHVSILHADGSLYGQKEVKLDGWGRVVRETDTLGNITEYNIDSFDRVIDTKWSTDFTPTSASSIRVAYDPQSTASLKAAVRCEENTLGKRSYDGLARLKHPQIGARETSFVYDGNGPQPTHLTNASGQKHFMVYEPALDFSMRSLQSCDSFDPFEYDRQTGEITQMESSYSTLQRHRLPSGKLASERVKMPGGTWLKSKWTYSLNGRLLSYVDVDGQTYTLRYDSFGRPSESIQGKVRVFFTYNKSNRLSRISTEDTTPGAGQSLVTENEYDEFGRETRRVFFQGQDVLYDRRQVFGKTNKVAERRTEDGRKNMLRQECFAYDNKHRLIHYTCEGSEPPVDENGWAIQKQTFSFNALDNLTEVTTISASGQVNTTSYQFSAQDPTQLVQIAQSHPDLKPNVKVEYNQQGALTSDDIGRSLEYDSRGCLSAVRDASDKELCRYQYDPTLKLVWQQVEGKPDTYLPY